ncbi:MAG: hypothetical protein IJ901_11735 [Bacteroidaceae bacterium]|nr:hypothetical protein [Bacteroidaceae bacterium]
MANVTSIPVQKQLLIDIEDESKLKDIKKAISLIRGVSKITIQRRKHSTGYERAMRDLKEGRVYEAKDVDDLFNQIFS